MGQINRFALFGLALLLAGALQASRLQQDFSDYGVSPTFFNQGICLDANGAVTGGTCALTAEDYLASNDPTHHVFDFRVEGNVSNFVLTLTGSVPLILDPNPDDNPALAFWAYGALVCKPIDPSFTNPPQCGPEPPSATTTYSLSADGMTATFTVGGANDPAHQYVFFAIVCEFGHDQGLACLPKPDQDNIVALDEISEPTVSAMLTPNTSEVPEPNTVPVLLLAGGAAATIFKRRSRKLA